MADLMLLTHSSPLPNLHPADTQASKPALCIRHFQLIFKAGSENKTTQNQQNPCSKHSLEQGLKSVLQVIMDDVSGESCETLDDVPAHVWKGLPDSMRLGPSAANPNRIGVWASRLIPKGKRFGPFAGERKKRSQVSSNVYMWEVYFPTRGWMCVDATDPVKGNWLRYVNWAHSSQEQNLFPLEINRAIYYKALRPIGPGEELLVWYNGEDNPEIAAALEEERSSNFGKKNSPRARRAKKKLFEKGRQASLERLPGQKPSHTTSPTVSKMRDSDGGINTEEQNPSASPDPSQETAASHLSSAEAKDLSPSHIPVAVSEQNEGEETEQGDPKQLRTHGSLEQSAESQSANPESLPGSPVKESSESLLRETECLSSVVSPELDPEGDPTFGEDGQGGTFHCQYCELQFAAKHELERHVQTHSVTANIFKCKYCAKPFGSQVGKRRHERRHENGSKVLKRPGLLTGTAFLFNSPRPNDSPTSPSPTVMSPNNGPAQPGSYALTIDTPSELDHPLLVDENGESKELHPCKYCNKAFGSHTNMRRHQRRIHERHLMPKGVRRKGMLLQDIPSQQQEAGQTTALQEASPNASPPLIYVPSVETDDDGERDDSMVDVSRNISENLSLYIDGKILATSTVSSCDVIEVDSSAPALFGLDAVILNPNQLSQALNIETQPCPVKELSVIGQAGPKRRTTTPPLLPAVKMESETSTSTSSPASLQSPSLGGAIFAQATETLTFQKEKAIYLSPKLKQLLQTQDSKKPADSCRLTTPLSIASLPAAQGRFKRRTASPPAPVQSSSPESSDSPGMETGNSLAIKVESHCVNYSWSASSSDQQDSSSPSAKDWPASISGGSSCNQQPLDLSSAVAKGDGGLSKGLGESVLDLSVQRNNATDLKAKASRSLQPHVKRKKPNTSMLEKVLMNEYSGLSSAGEEGSVCPGSPDAHLSPASVCSNSELPPFDSASPPSLTPVTMNPPSPSSSSQTSSTPPPPVLPSVPSPPTLAQFADFPSLSPKPVDPTLDETSRSSDCSVPYHDNTDLNQTATADALPPSPEDMTSRCTAGPASETLLTDSESDLNLLDRVSSCERNTDSQSNQSNSRDGSPPPHISIKTEVQSCHSPVHLTTNTESIPAPSQSPVEDGADSGTVGSKPVPDFISSSAKVPVKALDGANASEQDTFPKSFVCNVCEEPFHSIKQLSSHIIDHAGDWPFKCEFCVQLFQNAAALLEHRSSLHGVGRIYICPACSKEFAFLCNLQQHQSDLHPGQSLAHTTVENGKLRPQNYTDPAQVNVERIASTPDATADVAAEESPRLCNGNEIKKEENEDEQEDPTEELYTTIKIMASEAGKPKCPDVRLGINQHYPSFKPPPFPYHNRTSAGSVASATNFTTHNIPQTFSTAIRCTKCGNSFDNMPELHKHILACANASDKRRYTPKKNPIPLKQIIKQPHNGVVLPAGAAGGGHNAFRRMGQPKRLNFNQEVPSKMMSALNKKKNQLIQKAISQKNKAATSLKKVQVKQEDPGMHACPYCGREFIYPASLAKHVTCSCPQKPVAKKKKEALATQDKNMKLRSRAADSDIKPEVNLGPPLKALGKTRARSSERESEATPASKVKMVASQIRAKRPAHGKDPSAPKSKKGRKSKAPPAVPTSSLNDSASQPAAKVPRVGKDIAIKKEAEMKSQVQSKKEERFSKRMRDRVGGPMTRSSQMAGGAAPAEVKSEDSPNSETTPGEPKESC